MGSGEVSRAKQRRRAVARWRYDTRCMRINGVSLTGYPVTMWLDDKPRYLPPALRRYIDHRVRDPKPARMPRVWRRLRPEMQDRVLVTLTLPTWWGRYGALGLVPSAFRLRHWGV
jgi:hypothetical protein